MIAAAKKRMLFIVIDILEVKFYLGKAIDSYIQIQMIATSLNIYNNSINSLQIDLLLRSHRKMESLDSSNYIDLLTFLLLITH